MQSECSPIGEIQITWEQSEKQKKYHMQTLWYALFRVKMINARIINLHLSHYRLCDLKIFFNLFLLGLSLASSIFFISATSLLALLEILKNIMSPRQLAMSKMLISTMTPLFKLMCVSQKDILDRHFIVHASSCILCHQQ